MMNRQGGMGQLKCNVNNQDEVNPQSIGALGSSPSSSSLTGNFQRLPDSLSGSEFLHYQEINNVIPNNGCSYCVPRNIDLNADISGTNHYNDLNNAQNMSSSSANVNDSGVSGSGSVDVTRSSGKRSYAEHTARELVIGESSSSRGRQAGIAKRQASEANAYSSINISPPSPPSPGPINIPEMFESIIAHGAMRPVSDIQHSSATRQSENLQGNIQRRRANQETFHEHGSILENWSLRGSSLPTRQEPPFVYQFYNPSPSRGSETPIVAISSSRHPFEDVPSFSETSQAPSRMNILRAQTTRSAFTQTTRSAFTQTTRSAFSPVRAQTTRSTFSPVHTSIGRGHVATHFPYLRNAPGSSSILVPQVGRGNSTHNAGHSSSDNGTGNFHGGVRPTQYPYSSRIRPSTIPSWVPGSSAWRPSGIVNHPVVASTGFSRQNSNSTTGSEALAISQENDFTVFGSTMSQNRSRLEARSQNWSRLEAISQNQPSLVARSRNQAVDSVDIWLPENADFRIRLMIELDGSIDHLHRGGTLRRQDFMMPDRSIILRLHERPSASDEVNLDDLEDLEYELFSGLVSGNDGLEPQDLVALQENNVDTDSSGLSEEDILYHLWPEQFHISEGSTESDMCVICQEDYMEEEDVVKLHCDHRYHVKCIIAWLLRKNFCPICKQPSIPDHDFIRSLMNNS